MTDFHAPIKPTSVSLSTPTRLLQALQTARLPIHGTSHEPPHDSKSSLPTPPYPLRVEGRSQQAKLQPRPPHPPIDDPGIRSDTLFHIQLNAPC